MSGLVIPGFRLWISVAALSAAASFAASATQVHAPAVNNAPGSAATTPPSSQNQTYSPPPSSNTLQQPPTPGRGTVADFGPAPIAPAVTSTPSAARPPSDAARVQSQQQQFTRQVQQRVQQAISALQAARTSWTASRSSDQTRNSLATAEARVRDARAASPGSSGDVSTLLNLTGR